jgi:hypothetical protein
MSLKTYQNIEEHFDTIDCSIFSGELLEDDVAVEEMKEYLARWANAINEHVMVKQGLMKQKPDCDFSIYDKDTGEIEYVLFNSSHHPFFNPAQMRGKVSPRRFQETAEYLIDTWNKLYPKKHTH